MSEDISAALAFALGGVITAARKAGVSDDEIRKWVEAGLSSYRRMNSEPAER